jgi:hypothetical protein
MKNIIKSEIIKFINEQMSSTMTLYHGTGHLFNNFSSAKINTGQQSQDFGYGLYFTSNKETATFYANELSNNVTPIEKYEKHIINNNKNDMLYDYLSNNMIVSGKRILNSLINNNIGNIDEWQNLLNSLDEVERYGYVYTVEITSSNFINKDEYVVEKHRQNIDDKEMSKYLLSKDINGVFYKINSFGLNKTSDLSKEYNVIIFDDSIIKIISRERIDFVGTLKLDYIK